MVAHLREQKCFLIKTHTHTHTDEETTAWLSIALFSVYGNCNTMQSKQQVRDTLMIG